MTLLSFRLSEVTPSRKIPSPHTGGAPPSSSKPWVAFTAPRFCANNKSPGQKSGISKAEKRHIPLERQQGHRFLCHAGDGVGSTIGREGSQADDPWQLLGVSRTSNEDEIKASFRSKVKAVHPDVNRQESDAQERTTRLILAYEVVLGEALRQRAFQSQGFGDDAESRTGDEADDSLWPWVNETRCTGRACRYSCVERAPFMFSYAQDTGRARACTLASFPGWASTEEDREQQRYRVELAAGQCPELCIHFLTLEQRMWLQAELERVIRGDIEFSGASLAIQGYISTSEFENNRRSAPKRKPRKEGLFVDWF